MIQRDKKLEVLLLWLAVGVLVWLVGGVMFCGKARAEAPVFKEGAKGGYEWAMVPIAGTGESKLLVNTSKALTLGVKDIASGDDLKKATPLGKTVVGKLEKASGEIAEVRIGYRQIAVGVWPYPNGLWGEGAEDRKGVLWRVLGVLDEVLGEK